MGELGFANRSLWTLLLTGDGHPLPTLPRVDDVPVDPDPKLVRNLVEVYLQLLGDIDPQATVGFLLSRPGPGALLTSDHRWGQALRRMGREVGLRMQPVFLATGDAIHSLQPPQAAQPAPSVAASRSWTTSSSHATPRRAPPCRT